MGQQQAPKRTFPVRSAALMVAFVAAIQVCALLFTYFIAPVTVSTGYSFAPGGTSAAGSATSALVLVAGAFVTTFLAVWLIKKKRANVFTWIISVATTLALFLMTLLTTSAVASYLLDPNSGLVVSLVISAAVTIAFAYITRTPRLYAVAPVITGLLSAEVGSIFASTIPILTALLLAGVFSVYDIYAVFRGPLKQLVNIAPAETLTAVTSKVGEFTLGTGDTIFYSMLPAIALLESVSTTTFDYNLPFALATMVAIDVGVVMTLFLLSRSKMLPGLPIPMALGLATLLALTLL